MKAIYIAFLANCDESILDLKLKKGYDIIRIEYHQGFELIHKFKQNNRQLTTVSKIAQLGLVQQVEDPMYCVAREVEVADGEGESKKRAQGELMNLFAEGQEYLRNVVRLIRLFKHGNISAPLQAGYFANGAGPYMHTEDWIPIWYHQTLHLEPEDIKELEAFLSDHSLPFDDPLANLAFDSFEETYNILNRRLAFLACLVSIECLMNPGVGEVTYRISRNVATLLGRGKKDSQAIFEEIGRLYKVRSKIVHGNNSTLDLDNDLERARDFSRAIIKVYLKTKMAKKELMKLLSETGFSEKKPWQ